MIGGIQELVSPGVRFIAVIENIDMDESEPMARFCCTSPAAFAS